MARIRVQAVTVVFALCGLSLLLLGDQALAQEAVVNLESNSTADVTTSDQSKVTVSNHSTATSLAGDEATTMDHSAVTEQQSTLAIEVNDVNNGGSTSPSSGQLDELGSLPGQDAETLVDVETEAPRSKPSAANGVPATVDIGVAPAGYFWPVVARDADLTPVASVSSTTTASPNAPNDPPPSMPTNGLHRLADALGSSIVPLSLILGASSLPTAMVALVNLPAIISLLTIALVGGWFIHVLRRTGYQHAPRSDASLAVIFNFATPAKMGLMRSLWPFPDPSFRGVRNTKLANATWKGGDIHA